jgi:DNA-binding MarR family transcriptional regulator
MNLDNGESPPPIEALDFQSFVRFALDRAGQLEPPVDTDAAALILTLHRAASTVVYDLESSVHRPRGWSWAGFRLMFALWIVGSMDAKDAARIAGMSRQAASSQANTLEREGLLRRTKSPHDGRTVAFTLTAAGKKAIVNTYHEHNLRERIWAELLTPEERAAVTSALGKLLDLAPHLEVRRRD